ATRLLRGISFNTSNVAILVACKEATVTEILPFAAPAGTFTFSCVALASITVAAVLFANFTVLPAIVEEKLVPVTITVSPGNAIRGEKELMVGAGAFSVGGGS